MGGTFTVELFHAVQPSSSNQTTDEMNGVSTSFRGSSELQVFKTLLWDRKRDGGFPETKELKRRVRNVIEPDRDLGHVDRDHGKEKRNAASGNEASSSGDRADGEEEEGKEAGDVEEGNKKGQKGLQTDARERKTGEYRENCEGCA